MAAYELCVGKRRAATVLIVDDDRGFIRLIRRLLQSASGGKPAGDAATDASITVTSAYNGETAIAKARQHRPDMVLLDLLLPDMSGFEVLAQFQADTALADVPIVAVTAATPGEDELQAEGTTFTVARKGSFGPGEVIRLLQAALNEISTPGRLARRTETAPEIPAS